MMMIRTKIRIYLLFILMTMQPGSEPQNISSGSLSFGQEPSRQTPTPVPSASKKTSTSKETSGTMSPLEKLLTIFDSTLYAKQIALRVMSMMQVWSVLLLGQHWHTY